MVNAGVIHEYKTTVMNVNTKLVYDESSLVHPASSSERCGFYTHAQMVRFGTISWRVGTLIRTNLFRFWHNYTLEWFYWLLSFCFETTHMFGPLKCLHFKAVPDVEDSRLHILNIFISRFQLNNDHCTSNHGMHLYVHLFGYRTQKSSWQLMSTLASFHPPPEKEHSSTESLSWRYLSLSPGGQMSHRILFS